MPTLILSPRYSEDSITLRRAATDLGWDAMRLASWRVPVDFEPEDPAMFGEPAFNALVAEQLGLALLETPEDFLARLPQEYTRRRVRLMPASEARSLPDPVFLKPPNRKTFPAKIYASGADLPQMSAEDPVLASEPVDWAAEFRYFIRERRIHASSPYRLGGVLAHRDDEWVVDPEMAATTDALVGRLLANEAVDLPAAFVLDAGIIRGRGAAIVEANPAWGSGLYGCDPRSVLEVLRAATIADPRAGES